MLLQNRRADDESRDLLLFAELPIDEILDIRMVEVESHHLGCSTCGSARLDSARRAVANLQEREQATGGSTA